MKQFLTITLLFCSIIVANAVDHRQNVNKTILFQFHCDDTLVPQWEPCGQSQCIKWYIQTTCEESYIDYSTIPPRTVVTATYTSRRPATGLE